MIRAVILAGGSGTRLWPLSRASHPKQFLLLADGDETMLQATLNRLSDLEVQSSVIICNDEHRFFVAEQLREIDKLDSIILEPVGRNTAPAIALAALSSEDDPLLLVLAADHFIQDQAQFTKTVTDAIPLAESGKLVTFGIVPSEPHTGYGYIKCGEEVTPGFLVDQFVEKPSIKLAQDYVASGEFLWNSGMFLFKASRYLEELKIYRPDIYEACIAAMETTVTDLDFMRINSEAFEACPTESIDYAVMEKTKDAVVVPMNAGWNDIGSWSSLWDISKKDENGNSAYGDTIVLDSYNSYIRADDKLLVALGVSDLVVVSTKDAVMVANKKSVNDVKIITQQLKDSARNEWELHREVYRPWGRYDAIDNGYQYQVKRITVKPGAKLSVQKHQHRAEHWVVVSGMARVTKNEETFILSENESTFIPAGTIHSLENAGESDLEVIEVQSGSYLGEDDIIRLDDKYGRA